jgi:hypothetical protein
MPLGASRIEIISNALELIGDKAVTSANDNPNSRLANRFYDATYRSILSRGSFKFAKKTRQLNKLTDPVPSGPDDSYQNQFQIPSDCDYPIRVWPQSKYDIYADKIYSNEITLYLEYVFTESEGNLPGYFVEAFEHSLAARIAYPITKDRALAADYKELAHEKLMEAKRLDRASASAPALNNRMITGRRF